MNKEAINLAIHEAMGNCWHNYQADWDKGLSILCRCGMRFRTWAALTKSNPDYFSSRDLATEAVIKICDTEPKMVLFAKELHWRVCPPVDPQLEETCRKRNLRFWVKFYEITAPSEAICAALYETILEFKKPTTNPAEVPGEEKEDG